MHALRRWHGAPRLTSRGAPCRAFSRRRRGGQQRRGKAPAPASAARKEHPYREEALAQLLSAQPRSLTLWLDGVQDPHNLGACLRTADGAGCAAVVIPSRGAVGLTETVHSVARGAALAVPLIQVGSVAAAMKRCTELFGVQFVGLGDKAPKSLHDADLRKPRHLGLVMGSEGDGLRQQTAQACQQLVAIPMAGRVPCLNVSVAAGVTLFEAVRQRR